MVFINLFAFLSVKDKINRVRHCSNQDGRLIFLQCRTRVRYVLEIQNNFDTVFFFIRLDLTSISKVSSINTDRNGCA